VITSPAIQTAAISILHQRRLPGTPKNGANDRTGVWGELCQAQAGQRHGSAHASRSVVGLRSQQDGASKCNDILSIMINQRRAE